MVNEPVNDAPAGDFAARRASFVRVLQVLAMMIVALRGVCGRAPGTLGWSGWPKSWV